MSSNTDIGASIVVAFIISGCLFSTYYKVMKLSLGINVFEYDTFYSMLKRLHPIVKSILDEMCEEAKQEMKGKVGGVTSFIR